MPPPNPRGTIAMPATETKIEEKEGRLRSFNLINISHQTQKNVNNAIRIVVE